VTVWRSSNGASFKPHRIIDLPAVIGRTKTVLPAGPLWRWDPKASLDVEISSGAISSLDDEAVLAGGNLFAVKGADGRWEILSAARAEMIGERSYRLSRFLRGLAGTEPETARTVPVGALIVRLDEAIVPLATDLSDLGQTWRYRIGPAGRDHADPSMAEISALVGREAFMPLSPVRTALSRDASGVRIAWIRRTRRGGDGWESLDVPLSEEIERYEIDVLKGGVIVRTLTSTEPTALYSNEQEIADFGAPQTTLDLRVAQVSAVAGRGFEARVALPVR
jgi:hypothetical protein